MLVMIRRGEPGGQHGSMPRMRLGLPRALYHGTMCLGRRVISNAMEDRSKVAYSRCLS